MTAKRQLLVIWFILALANIYTLVTDIVNNVGLPLTLFGVLALLTSLWLLWDAYRSYKRERDAQQQHLMTMHNVFISLNHAEADAKETAAKIASELHYKLKND